MGEARAWLQLLGSFDAVIAGRSTPLGVGSQRLLAYLGVSGRAIERRAIAGTLWPDKDSRRADANLRSAIWRIPKPGLSILHTDHGMVRLAPEVECDVHRMEASCRDLLVGDTGVENVSTVSLASDLLPGWDEEWLIVERERLRQQRLHALEVLSTRLRREGRVPEAIDAALAAVWAEPLRESATRTLIVAHLAEDNLAEAWVVYHRFAKLLSDELGACPSSGLRDLLGAVTRE